MLQCVGSLLLRLEWDSNPQPSGRPVERLRLYQCATTSHSIRTGLHEGHAEHSQDLENTTTDHADRNEKPLKYLDQILGQSSFHLSSEQMEIITDGHKLC